MRITISYQIVVLRTSNANLVDFRYNVQRPTESVAQTDRYLRNLSWFSGCCENRIAGGEDTFIMLRSHLKSVVSLEFRVRLECTVIPNAFFFYLYVRMFENNSTLNCVPLTYRPNPHSAASRHPIGTKSGNNQLPSLSVHLANRPIRLQIHTCAE